MADAVLTDAEPVILTPQELQQMLRNVWNAGYSAGRHELSMWLSQGGTGSAPERAANPWG